MNVPNLYSEEQIQININKDTLYDSNLTADDINYVDNADDNDITDDISVVNNTDDNDFTNDITIDDDIDGPVNENNDENNYYEERILKLFNDREKANQLTNFTGVLKRDPLVSGFQLETDHIAFRNNPEYRKLLSCLIHLQTHREQSIKDMTTLINKKAVALNDPLDFVRRLSAGEDMDFPPRYNIEKVSRSPTIIMLSYPQSIPFVNWTRHIKSAQVPCLVKDRNMRESTKKVATIPDIEMETPSLFPNFSAHNASRGKVVKGDKDSPSFNRLWTNDEQLKLENLLQVYPMETVEAKRYEKIALELPNRTKQQVASRVQKYFKKLKRSGLPIPGRTPRQDSQIVNKAGHSCKRRTTNLITSQSTFLTSVNPTVYMNNSENYAKNKNLAKNATLTGKNDNGTPTADDESLPIEIKHTPEFQKLLRIKQLREGLEVTAPTADTVVRHYGYQCNKCSCEPIIGVRHHCNQCPEEICVDLCGDCIKTKYESSVHTSDHTFKSIGEADIADSGDHNQYRYLDPNFMPGHIP